MHLKLNVRISELVFLLFFSASVLIVLLHLKYHPVRVFGMDTSIFYMDEKYTLASYLSVLLAFLVGCIYITLSFIAKEKNKTRSVNRFLGAFFFFLSFDEYFEVHEYINTVIKEIYEKGSTMGDLARFSWIFPFLIVILLVFVMYIRKLWCMKDKLIRRVLLFAMLCFFFVLVFELMGSATYGEHIYITYVALEEGLEMVGLTLFLYAASIEAENMFHMMYKKVRV